MSRSASPRQNRRGRCSLLLGIDEDVANVLQAGQEEDLVGQSLAGLERFGNGLFQAAERDLAERSRGIDIGRGVLDQLGPLGLDLGNFVDAGVFDEAVGTDGNAADRLLERGNDDILYVKLAG